MNRRDLILKQVVEHFLETEQLGDYDELSSSLTLYAVPNNPKNIDDIKKYMTSVTIRHQVIVLSPDEELSNIKILDIGI